MRRLSYVLGFYRGFRSWIIIIPVCKIPLKWMIWGYTHLWKPPYILYIIILYIIILYIIICININILGSIIIINQQGFCSHHGLAGWPRSSLWLWCWPWSQRPCRSPPCCRSSTQGPQTTKGWCFRLFRGSEQIPNIPQPLGLKSGNIEIRMK